MLQQIKKTLTFSKEKNNYRKSSSDSVTFEKAQTKFVKHPGELQEEKLQPNLNINEMKIYLYPFMKNIVVRALLITASWSLNWKEISNGLHD